MNKINKINVCCQKVLPLVYDESLSYYEVLCKVIQKLNELIKINNNIRDEVHSDYLAVLEGAKVATEAVASVTAMRDEVLTLKQATEQYAHDVVTVYNQTVEARDTAIAKANIAEQSATTATQKAEIASTSATTATEKANIAVQSANTATQKANSAQQSASTATEKANIATEKAESAVQSANTATAKADIAVESANTATEKANIASTYATTATQKAESASTSADTAIAKAQEASASASTASTKADSAKHDASLSSTMAQNARASAEEAQTNADKVLTSMSLVSGTVNYYKSDEVAIMVDEDGTYAYTTPYIRNNVLYINVRLEYTLYGPLTINLPNLTKKTINFTPVINWATGVIENIDLSNLPHTVFTGGGTTIINGEQFITNCVSSYRSFPTYVLGLQMFSNEKTQITLESGKHITIPFYFTLIQPLVFDGETN